MMKTLSAVITLTLFVFSNSALACREDSKPNVILVMTDDQGYGDLSCHGNPILKTPNLDRLHSESIRFTDFHVSPFCTPTRAALMTGNYPGYTGAYRTSSGRTMMHPDEKTLANLFSNAGYITGMVGKWHLGDNAPHRPQDRGFQHVLWHRCGGIGQASDYWGNDYFGDTYERATPENKQGKFEKFEGYCTDVWFKEGIRFVESNRSKPFFLYLALNAPHGPYRVDPKWTEPYADNKKVANANFFGMVANIDHNMGILRQRLDALGLTENTILIFMTDNGTAAGAKFNGLDSEAVTGFNAGMRGKKSSIYDGGHRVPLFIHWPKGKLTGGKDIETLAAHIDVLPTLADLCSIPVAKSFAPDGISLKPLIDGSKKPWPRKHHFVQFHGAAGGNALPPQPLAHSVVMTERWRLVNMEKQALYDIQADPAQRNDISEKFPEVVKQLREAYKPFWNQISPRMTPVCIDLGNPDEKITRLCSQDWHLKKGNPPWWFGSIKKLPKVTGPWMVDVKEKGRYAIILRQWPAEANKLLVAVKAKVVIAGRQKEMTIPAGNKEIRMELNLPAGRTELWTYLYNKSGQVGGAYFTDVTLLKENGSPRASKVTDEKKNRSRKRDPFANQKDDPDLPNVLLIGDSISIGYTKFVQKELAGKADVFRIPGNGKYSGFGLQNLDKWLGTRKWDVIHFNWGLWDLCYRNPKSKTQGNRDKVDGKLTTSLDQYRINLEKIVKRLKKTEAKLIWCATTPVPEHEAGRKLGDDIKYNTVAEKIMKANGVSINDLHAHALLKLPGIQVQKGDVHFTSQGYAYLAEKVVRDISAALPK